MPRRRGASPRPRPPAASQKRRPQAAILPRRWSTCRSRAVGSTESQPRSGWPIVSARGVGPCPVPANGRHLESGSVPARVWTGGPTSFVTSSRPKCLHRRDVGHRGHNVVDPQAFVGAAGSGASVSERAATSGPTRAGTSSVYQDWSTPLTIAQTSRGGGRRCWLLETCGESPSRMTARMFAGTLSGLSG
jgi:hypothetical protein